MKNKFYNRKKKYLILVNFAIILLSYSIYIFNSHYSEDTFEALLDIGALASTNLRNGRIFHFILYKVFSALNFNILAKQCLVQLIMTAILAIGTTLICLRFYKLFNQDNLVLLFCLDIVMLFMIINPCFLFGWYYWPETCLGASLSLAVTFGAILMWCKDNRKWYDCCLSFILLCISISMYQVYVEWYVGMCLAYVLLQNYFKVNAKSIKEFICIILFGGIGSVINILSMSVLQKLNIIETDERSATTSIETLISNAVEIFKDQVNIWNDMMGLMPKGYMACLAFGIISLIIAGCIFMKSKVNILSIVFTIVILLSVYVLAFVPNIISSLVWLAPRTYIGLYCFVVICMLIALYFCYKQETLMKLCMAVLGVFFFLMIFHLHVLETNTIISNRFDEFEISTICDRIDNYQEENQIYVDQIIYAYDSSRRYDYDQVEFVAYDNNVRGLAYDWCFENMIKYYYRTDLKFEQMADEEYVTLFENSQWDSFEPDEQMIFIGSTLYMIIY